MKTNLNKIKAALQQLEQNPNFCDRLLVTSSPDSTADTTAGVISEVATFSQPIPPLQPNCKAPTLPTFNSRRKEKVSEAASLATTPPPTLVEELQQIIQQIENLYLEGPIVDGWLESYPCESAPSNDEAVNEIASLEYVIAGGSLAKDRVICETPRSCYRLRGVSATGQQWSYPCPMEELPKVSVAIARYEKLLQLLARKQDLETLLKPL